MNWRIKGVVQKALSVLPGGTELHYILQRRYGGLRDFNAECDTKVDDWRLMLGHLDSVGIALPGARMLEMGTGWYPTFPFCLFLGGAARVDTVDLTPHLRPDLTRMCATRLGSHTAVIADSSGCTESEVAARQRALAAALGRGESILAATNGVVSYRAPCDASDTKLKDAAVDVVFSNSVLEHVPGPVIEACFAESRRILRSRGVIFHSVNCGDHYAYVDRAIDQLHYLVYSRRAWQFWNNAFLYQNRLRAADFTRMARNAGFAIEVDTSRARPERLAQLEAITVHPEFAHYSRDQLAITSIDFIGRNP
jgi:SAM-dependent methyltransferase